MRAVVQRVSTASVAVDNDVIGHIGAGLLVYVAAAPDDTTDDVRYLADKIANLRIFNDDHGKLNRSLIEARGAVLLISAFALLGDARRGRRPSFTGSAPGDVAAPLVEDLATALRYIGLPVATGQFAAHMLIKSVNDGPITILLDSRRLF